METKGDTKTPVHMALERKLPGFSPKEISALATKIGGLSAHGLKIDDAFPQGIPASPDAVTISGTLELGKLPNLGDLVKAAGPIKSINVFPRGIPAQPEFMRVDVTISR